MSIPDDDELFTTAEAAEEVGVAVATLHGWVFRGYLTPAKRRGHTNLYRISDVFACEAARQRKYRKNLAA